MISQNIFSYPINFLTLLISKVANRKQSQPISRILCPELLRVTTIPLGQVSPLGSSSLPAGSAGRFNACLFEIAPGGGYRVSPFGTYAKDSSLWPYSARHRGWSLAITLPYGVRTFLPFAARSSGCLVDFAGRSLTALAHTFINTEAFIFTLLGI